MDLSFTKEQKLIRDAAAEFLKKECPRDLVRQMENDDLGYPPELWSKMAELGWLGLIIAEEYGGLGGSFLELVVLLEEMGKYLVPSPIIPTEVLGGLSIMNAGTEEHKKKYLPKVAKGELLLTMALNQNYNNIDGIDTDFQITKIGKDSMISGTRLFVPYAHVSDYIVCPIQMKDNKEKENAISLFLIEGKSSGVSCTPLETTACDKQCKLVFNSVKLDRENILSGCRSGSEVVRNVLERAALAQCALMIGGGEAVLRMTVDHAKKRVQFDRPIGSFQAVQHRCANMLVDLDGARYSTYLAAWKIDEGLPCTLDISVAKAWANQAYQRICANGHQVIGGTGVMMDHDMQLYSRRAKAAEFIWGDTVFHKEIIAQQLGL